VIGSRVLDTSALRGFVRRSPYVEAVVWSSVMDHVMLLVPPPPSAAAYGQLPESDWDIVRTLLDLPVTVTAGDLTRDTATELASTLRPAGGFAPAALTAASVVHAARHRGWPVLTGEPDPLRALWTEVLVEPLP
jgi:hypothetical protein